MEKQEKMIEIPLPVYEVFLKQTEQIIDPEKFNFAFTQFKRLLYKEVLNFFVQMLAFM